MEKMDTVDEARAFIQERAERIRAMGQNRELKTTAQAFTEESTKAGYSYNFSWMGRPIIQYPQDMLAMQEIVWDMRPDAIFETGIAHGGSLIYSASLLQLLGGDGFVLGVDIDIRAHNRAAIEAHPMSPRIRMFEGSSIDEAMAQRVHAELAGCKNPLVVLDSNHTHEHVLRELELYSPLVRKGGWLVVFDTVVEIMPGDFYPDRPWGLGDNPMTAVDAFLKTNDRFVIDEAMDAKLSVSMAPRGYLRCVRD
ncbi:MAG: cephalosporin hydroxylase family protein [Humidesulfovibrio sp.]|jgi:cephalosporin hydroxylase|uniref:cephalosporin hydroxylase family protein n=1 Tax=Humidesulfovibrio sp. TaxID=2910988 RepID=UPI002732B661|nr:cephalosporin hydroxylase family protein [Humidesulfovibrio sp.]MDP2847066.1 cephalosporin hydroxylase family protein [Humidesulfovibrio sp.]